MKTIVVTQYGGPEVLELQDRPDPQPGPTQLVVDNHVAGVNFRDIYERRAPGFGPGDPPFVAGLEGAGTVAAVGDQVTEFRPGDRVVWNGAFGSYAEQVLVEERAALPVPDGIELETAAAVLLQGITAHYLSQSVYPAQEGDWVLVNAGAGGVGRLLTQMVKMRGGHVIATTSGGEKAELARAAGADEAIAYDEVPDRVLELTGGEGVRAAFDGVGKDTFDKSLASLGMRGIVALYGAPSGQPEPLDLIRLGPKSLVVTRTGTVAFTRTQEELLWRVSDVFGWVAEGKLDVRIGGRYPLADAWQAQEDLENRRTTGKLILTVR